jgi:hypothetical protein
MFLSARARNRIGYSLFVALDGALFHALPEAARFSIFASVCS